MAKKGSPPKKATESIPVETAIPSDEVVIAELYDLATATIEAAVTGSLLTGMHPAVMEHNLAIFFMQAAALARNKSEQAAAEWLSEENALSEKVIKAVIDFANAYKEPLHDLGEAEELSNIIKVANAHRPFPKTKELKIQSKQAIEVLNWAIGTAASMPDMPLEIVELVFLIQYLRVASMNPKVSNRVYCVVRQSAPAVMTAYNHLLV